MNGLAIDRKGRLLAAENGDAVQGTTTRITRTDLHTRAIEVLAESFERRAFNGPNDLVVDDNGVIYFTDWAHPTLCRPCPIESEILSRSYRIERDDRIRRLLTVPQVEAPNGVMVSPTIARSILSSRIVDPRAPGG